MSEDGNKRYLGDVVFEALNTGPEFLKVAREMVAGDWRNGTDKFRQQVAPITDGIMSADGFEQAEMWGELDLGYIEGRVMQGSIDQHRDPWLWVYKQLTGAYIDPAVARTALDRIAREGR